MIAEPSRVHLGYSLSSEEHAAPDLVRFVRQAEILPAFR